MAIADPTYDLVLMLDSSIEPEQRDKVLADVERIIETTGVIANRQDWGVRQTAYEIRHKTDADYHLLQFHGDRTVLETLQRTLRITDGVVRFRIIKLDPGTPAPPSTRPEPRPTGVTDDAAVSGAEPVAASAPADTDA
jgi:small subunit ribosomal protein S6